jgi:hypothetical protein
MGKKGSKGSSKPTKSHKSALNKFSSKKSSTKKVTQDRKGQTVSGAGAGVVRENSTFNHQISELRARITGKKKKKVKPTLNVKAATFTMPKKSEPSEPETMVDGPSLVEQLLEGEENKFKQLKAKKVKQHAESSSKNRFSMFENDEILEDGSHSIFKMDVKPPTFVLKST